LVAGKSNQVVADGAVEEIEPWDEVVDRLKAMIDRKEAGISGDQ